MVTEKFMHTVNGSMSEKTALVSSGGAGDAGKIVAVGVDGKLDSTVMPSGIVAETSTALTSEILVANDVVNVYDDAGTLKVRKADATDDTKPATGYVLAGFASGVQATIYTGGYLPGVALTIGKYFLAVGGGISNVVPNATGNIIQSIGRAISTTKIKFVADQNYIIIEA